MRRGEDTVIPNWALDAISTLTLASDIKILMFLVRYRQYRTNSFSTKQLAIALEIDLRTVQSGVARLAALGHLSTTEGRHSARPKTTSDAQGSNIMRASSLQASNKSTRVDPPLDTVLDEEKTSLNKGSKEERKRASTQEAHAASDLPEPTPPQTEAVAFFTRLCGPHFVKFQIQNLDRWFAQYSQDFIRLAWKLCGRSENPRYTFGDWLDRAPSKPWPDALRAQYEGDVAPDVPTRPAAEAPPALPVRVGQQVRWPDGVIATVERCDRVEFVTDAEDDARGYVPYTAIGRGVEVLHS